MNFFRVQSALLTGIQAMPVQIECAQSRRLPYLQILGGSGMSSGELRERVIAALGTLQAGKFRLPARRFTVQIAPRAGNLPLESLDLAVAVAILGSMGIFPAEKLDEILVCGALGLDGSLSFSGSPAVIRRLMQEMKCKSALLPWEGSEALEESQLNRGGGFRTLAGIVNFLQGEASPGRRTQILRADNFDPGSADRIWAEISGQELPKRVLEISAAGAHHLLLPGPKSARSELFAQALRLLLPSLNEREKEEVNGIYALAGANRHPRLRPFHIFREGSNFLPLLHDRSLQGIEEALLAHHGVLYLDQVCELEREIFPALSQPMLKGVLPTRLYGRRGEIPLNLLVVASTPICACGASGDSRLVCVCRPTEAKRFAHRWRRLLQYPFDLCLNLAPERKQKGGVPGRK